jgi:hypothetical protein
MKRTSTIDFLPSCQCHSNYEGETSDLRTVIIEFTGWLNHEITSVSFFRGCGLRPVACRDTPIPFDEVTTIES